MSEATDPVEKCLSMGRQHNNDSVECTNIQDEGARFQCATFEWGQVSSVQTLGGAGFQCTEI